MSTKTEALVSAAMSTLNHLGRMVGNSEHENSRIRAALTAAFSKCALLTAPAEPAPILASALTDERINDILRELRAKAAENEDPVTAVDVARAIEREVLARLSKPTSQGTAQSIDTQEFRELMCHLGYWVDEDDAWNDECGAALVEFINRHIAAQAPAGRDASHADSVKIRDEALEEAAKLIESHCVFDPNSDESKEEFVEWLLRNRAGRIRSLKTNAAEQTSGGAK